MNTKRTNPSCRPGTTEAMERLAAENNDLRAGLAATSQDLKYWYNEAERRLDENNLLDRMNQDLESTCERLLDACKKAKAQGAREALHRALYPPNFSDTVVRVDRLLAVIADMEGEL